MLLSNISCYPVKSLSGISLDEAVIDDFGIKGDRRWMLVDVEGRFVTQRKFPKLALVSAVVSTAPNVNVTFPDGVSYIAQPDASRIIDVEVWSDKCKASLSINKKLDQAMSLYLGVDVRFVYMSDSVYRQVDRDFYNQERRVSFADGFPLLLVSSTSLAELNSRLSQEVGIDRFRANIVVSGVKEPFAEDDWKIISIGDVDFAVVKPCSRCVMTTVNPKTGEKGKEPLMTLSRFRKQEGGVMFGQNLVPLNDGVIRVGDSVDVMR